MNSTADTATPRIPRALQMAMLTFSVLVLELALIRWVAAQIRIAGYFTNLVLLASFLGLGLGVGLGSRHPRLLRAALPTLAVIAVILGTSELTGLCYVKFPDLSIMLWGGEDVGTLLDFAKAALLMTVCFWAVASVFVFIGAAVGKLFDEMPPLQAYGADIAGSLAGVIAMTAASWLGATPPVWFALGVLPVLALSRSAYAFAAAFIVLASAWYSCGAAIFSPYSRITVLSSLAKVSPKSNEFELDINRVFHQYLLDLAPDPNETDSKRALVRRAYDLPFRVTSGDARSALIVGAGSGNDVAAALRNGIATVTSVDIDPRIIEIGRRLHPEKPYSDPRVIPVVNDARAFFEQNPDQRFDVVCYGLLDSHALFSAMSSLRLDNYVYTVDGLASGWRHVRDDGVMTVSFSVWGGDWLIQRMFRSLQAATGIQPIVVQHRYNDGVTFIVGRHLDVARINALFPDVPVGTPPESEIRVPTDDWPFLYLRPGVVPWAYLVVFALIALTSFAAVRSVFFRGSTGARRFDMQMFLLGAGFMLIETRMVTQLSLLFGSTWIVNSSVFGGILLMILLANTISQRRQLPPNAAYAALFVSIAAIWAVPAGALNALELLPRLAVAGVVFSIPVFFAGTIFSGALRARRDVSAALGSNLCGAMVGGMLEYLSMLVGMRAIAMLALLVYVGSLWAARRRVESPRVSLTELGASG